MNMDKMNLSSFRTILECLEVEDMCNYLAALMMSNKQQNKIYIQILKITICFAKYYNKFDRSYYFEVFGENKYKAAEQDHLFKIYQINPNAQFFCQFPDKFQAILFSVLNWVPKDKEGNDIRGQFNKGLRNIILQPIGPLPRLVRQGCGAITSSGFQQFLSFRSDSQNFRGNVFQKVFYKAFQQLKTIQQQKDLLQQMLKNKLIVNQLYNNAHLITSNNFSCLLINNKLHNLIVHIYALAELLLSGMEIYLSSIEDSFQLLLQLCMKYTHFNNVVLCIQENLSQYYKTYQNVYKIFNKENEKEKYQLTFYRPAMKMWINKMSKFHNITNQVFGELELNQINNRFHKYLGDKYSNLQTYQYLPNLNKQVQSESIVYELMKKQKYQLSSLVNTYQQYMVDISVNEVSVHYCAHSQQKFDKYYLQLEQILLNKERQYIQEFKNFILNFGQFNYLNQVLNKRLQAYEYYSKKPTIKKIIKLYSDQGVSLYSQNLQRLNKQVENYIQYLVRNKRMIYSQLLSSSAKNTGNQMEQQNYQQTLMVQ